MPAPSDPRISSVARASRSEWTGAAEGDPSASATQLPGWADAIADATGWRDASRTYVFTDGRRVVLPLVARARGLVLGSWPSSWTLGGPVADGGVRPAERDAVVAAIARERIVGARLLLPGAVPAPVGTRMTAQPRLVHALSLAGGYETVSAERYDKQVRKYVRRSAAEGVTVREGTGDAQLDVFEALYAASVIRWARDRGQPAFVRALLRPVEFHRRQLRAVRRHLGDRMSVRTAWLDGTPVSAMVSLRHGTRVTAWLAATDIAAAGRSRPQHLLHDVLIRDACDTGATVVDLGESDPGSGVAQWKEQLGAEPVTATELRIDRVPVQRAVTAARSVVNRRSGSRSG